MNTMKDQIAADLQKAKEVSGARVERIRQIFRDALNQSVAELKEGGSEIGSIAKTTLKVTLQDQSRPTNQDAVQRPIPVEVIIETEDETDDEMAQDAVHETSAVQADDVIAPTVELTEIQVVQPDGSESSEVPQSGALQSLLNRMVDLLKKEGVYDKVEQQWGEFRTQLENLDAKLDEQWGNRYITFKQDLRKDARGAKDWYSKTKESATSEGKFWVDEKQAELEMKAGEAGATLAQKEAKIKQLLKELWQTATR